MNKNIKIRDSGTVLKSGPGPNLMVFLMGWDELQDGTGWDGMGQDRLEWDRLGGMGWDGTSWDRMGWDRMGQDGMG